MAQRSAIPVIDLFAGPGGLCEGFSSIVDENGLPHFAVRISIEKDPVAHRTLMLRALFRKFPKGEVPASYYEYVRGNLSRETFLAHPEIKEAAESGLKELKIELTKVNPTIDWEAEKSMHFSARFPFVKKFEESELGNNIILDLE